MKDFETQLNTLGEMGREIKMTETEKSFVRANISEFISKNPLPTGNTVPIKSPFTVSPFSIFTFGRVATLVFVGLILGTTGISYASLGSLPGDTLYPIKTGVIEQVKGSLVAKTPEQKLAYEENLMYKRLDEIEELKKRDRLDTKTSIYAQNAIAIQSERFNKASIAVETSNTELAIEINDNVSREFKKRENSLRGNDVDIDVGTSLMMMSSISVEPTAKVSPNAKIIANPLAEEMKVRREHLDEKRKMIEQVREEKRSSLTDEMNGLIEKNIKEKEIESKEDRESTSTTKEDLRNNELIDMEVHLKPNLPF